MTVSCQTWGREWGTDDMVAAMRDLRSMGVNWIAIHPYAGIRANGTVVMQRRAYLECSWLTRPIREAHALGLKIMIKPHLAYWGSPFRWRGEIEFHEEQEWDRFFDTYEHWILTLAKICSDADAFVIGTELDRTIQHQRRWRQIIGALRGRLDVPLTYAANWNAYEAVPFWDALDAIGVQAYFPLTAKEELPSAQDLDAAWERIVRNLEHYAEHLGRNVILTELGYDLSARAAREPWNPRQEGPHAEETQRRCLTAALKAIGNSERIRGAFLWKWFAGPTHPENFLMSTPNNCDVIRSYWNPRPPALPRTGG